MQDPKALIDDYLDESIDEASFKTLCQWLEKGEANQRVFIKRITLHNTISEWSAERSGRSLPIALSGVAETEDTGETASWIDAFIEQDDAIAAKRDTSSADTLSLKQIASLAGYALGQALTSKPAYKAYGVAAAFLIAVTLFMVFGPGDDNTATDPLAGQEPIQDVSPDVANVPMSPIVATLTAEHNSVWDRRPGQDLYAGQRFTLTQGFAEITTIDGAVVILEAPATIELIDNNNAVHLHSGKLVGLCHTKSSKGFVVKTAYADITDLGTEFAVEAHAEGVDTTVFVGKVTLTTPDGATQPITNNQTARLTFENGQRMIAFEDNIAEGFVRRLPRQPVITAAHTNLPNYTPQVVAQGVYEDARVYFNREHEINGIDASSGIPTVLLDGDRVMMDTFPVGQNALFPDEPDLNLELDFAQPVDLYILFKETDPPLDWMKREFIDTGLKVGLDLGSEENKAATGPGNSIENVLGVWKRTAPASGTLTLDYGRGRTMFLVVAVPAKEERGNTRP